MFQIFYLSLAFGAGMVLGALHFVSLWAMLQKLRSARHPALLAIVAYVLRMAVTLLGFYFVMGGRWERLLICFAGFRLMRIYLVRQRGPRRRA